MRINLSTKTANSFPMRKITNWMSKPIKKVGRNGELITRYDVVQKHLPVILGTWITAFQAYATYKSKDIPAERKNTLVINIISGSLISTSLYYPISASLDNVKNRFIARFDEIAVNNAKKPSLRNGIKVAIPFLISEFTARYFAPVIATPLADKINKFMIKNGYTKVKDNPNKTEA